MTNNNPPILLKIRGGVEVDSYGKRAGKGPLLSENLSMTLGVSQDQYLFQPVVVDTSHADSVVRVGTIVPTLQGRDYKGGKLIMVSQIYSVENHPNDSRYRIDDSGIVQTLMGRMWTGGGNEPIVMLEQKTFDARGNGDGEITAVACFQNTGHGWWNGSDIGATVRTPCGGDSIKANLVCTTVINLNKAVVYSSSCFTDDGRHNGKITATITGVHEHSISDYTNVIVLRLDNGSAYPVVCGDKSPTIRRGNGPGGTGHVAVCFQQNQRDEVRIMEKPGAITAQPWMKCQNFIAEHAVCYGISSMDSNAMRSSNPHSGIYEAKTSRTLDLNGGNPACNQGGIIICQRKTDVVYPEKTGPLMANSHPGSYCGQDAYQDMFVVERRG